MALLFLPKVRLFLFYQPHLPAGYLVSFQKADYATWTENSTLSHVRRQVTPGIFGNWWSISLVYAVAFRFTATAMTRKMFAREAFRKRWKNPNRHRDTVKLEHVAHTIIMNQALTIWKSSNNAGSSRMEEVQDQMILSDGAVSMNVGIARNYFATVRDAHTETTPYCVATRRLELDEASAITGLRCSDQESNIITPVSGKSLESIRIRRAKQHQTWTFAETIWDPLDWAYMISLSESGARLLPTGMAGCAAACKNADAAGAAVAGTFRGQGDCSTRSTAVMSLPRSAAPLLAMRWQVIFLRPTSASIRDFLLVGPSFAGRAHSCFSDVDLVGWAIRTDRITGCT